MADQATLKRNGSATGRAGIVPDGDGESRSGNQDGTYAGNMVSNVAEFGDNLLTLSELQARLSLIELKQNVEALKGGGAVVLAGAAVAFACLPLILAGVAELLVSELGMKRGYSLLSVALVALTIAIACIALAGSRLRRTVGGFPLTHEEFTRNMNWVRTVLLYSGRSMRRR